MVARTNPDGLSGRVERLAEDTGEAIRQIGNKAEDRLQGAAATVARAQKAIAGQAQAAADTAHDYVHENPWKTIAIATAVGLLIGILLSGRR
jgi:ElaB/YqjD/DUF883 family membrane-anchored ribosome-binding protein